MELDVTWDMLTEKALKDSESLTRDDLLILLQGYMSLYLTQTEYVHTLEKLLALDSVEA
jgi:hypothetical protein